MAAGFQIRDPSTGALRLRVTDRLTMIRGSFSTGTGNGSFDIASTGAIDSTNSCFFIVRDSNLVDSFTKPPQVSMSGSVITWAFPSGSNTNRSVDILYGTW